MERHLVFIGIILVAVMPMDTGLAQDAMVSVGYGGVDFDQNVVARSENGRGAVAASRIFGGDILGPEVFVGLRPQLSIDFLWSGESWNFAVTTESRATSFGVVKVFGLGQTQCEVFAGAAHIQDKYQIVFVEGEHYTHDLTKWGLAGGAKLRFPFLNQLDAVGGYRFYRRAQVEFDGSLPLAGPYEVTGRSTDHCFWFGVCYVIGMS